LKNDFSLKGNKLLYDRTKKLLRAEGNIVMKDNKNDVGIRAHFLESKNDGEFMIVQLGVRITKSDDLSARTEFLTYTSQYSVFASFCQCCLGIIC
jgi:lipopolysaccharide assembly outer membrane protein LptD (OstA)